MLVGSLAAVLVDPRGCARPARHPLALVTADTEAHVVVLSLVTAAVRDRVRTLEGPRSVERFAGGALVAHPSEGAVTLLEGRPVRVRRREDAPDTSAATAEALPASAERTRRRDRRAGRPMRSHRLSIGELPQPPP